MGTADKPDVLKEFVLYDEAKETIEELSDELDALQMKYLSQVSLYKSLYNEAKKKLEQYESNSNI